MATTDTDAGSQVGSTTDSSESDSTSGADSGFADGSHLAHLLDAQAGELGQP